MPTTVRNNSFDPLHVKLETNEKCRKRFTGGHSQVSFASIMRIPITFLVTSCLVS